MILLLIYSITENREGFRKDELGSLFWVAQKSCTITLQNKLVNDIL
jgi:hypothetical protein